MLLDVPRIDFIIGCASLPSHATPTPHSFCCLTSHLFPTLPKPYLGFHFAFILVFVYPYPTLKVTFYVNHKTMSFNIDTK